MRRDLHKPPDHGKRVIRINFYRTRIASGCACAMNHAVRHAPRLHGIGVSLHDEGPTVEAGAVEKLNRVNLSSRCHFASRKNSQGDCKYDERQNFYGGFHGRNIADDASDSQVDIFYTN